MATNRDSSNRPSGRTVALAFAVAAAAAIAFIVVALVFRASGDAPAPTATPRVDLAGIPQTDRVLGDRSANVTLIWYADAQCPGCRYYAQALFPTIVDNYVRTGKVKTEFRGFPFIGSDSVQALRFIYAAGLQNKLWQFQEALYRNQGAEGSGWVTDDLLRQVAGEISGLNVDKLFADADSEKITQEADAAEGKARAAGIPGTPTLLIKVRDAKPYYVQVSTVEQARAALDDALQG